MKPRISLTTACEYRLPIPKVGLEPTLPCGKRILNPSRLPIPPLRRLNHYIEQWAPQTLETSKRKVCRQTIARAAPDSVRWACSLAESPARRLGRSKA